VAAAVEILRRQATTMDRIRELLNKNNLAGYFYAIINDAGVADYLSDELLRELKSSYLKQVRRNDCLLELLKKLQEEFESASVPFLTLKGIYLSQRFMGDFRRRFMWDLDILVQPADLGHAVDAAITAGLEHKSSVPLDPRIQRWGLHAIDLKGELGNLDIHFALRNLPGIDFNYERIWATSGTFNVDGVSFPTIDDEHTLLISLLGVGTDIQCSHHNLRKILDIFLMLLDLDESMDWEVFFANRQTEGTLKLVLNVLAFCIHYLADFSDCPSLVQSMESRKKLIRVESTAAAESIFMRGRQSIANRLFFSRLLPVSMSYYWIWWLLTLPLRYWQHR